VEPTRHLLTVARPQLGRIDIWALDAEGRPSTSTSTSTFKATLQLTFDPSGRYLLAIQDERMVSFDVEASNQLTMRAQLALPNLRLQRRRGGRSHGPASEVPTLVRPPAGQTSSQATRGRVCSTTAGLLRSRV